MNKGFLTTETNIQLIDAVWNGKFLWFWRGIKSEMRFHKSFDSIVTAQLKSSYIFVGLAVSDINEGSKCYEIKKVFYECIFFEITPWGILSI